MHIFNDVVKLQLALDSYRKKNETIAFVPTMGGLHEGHLSLVRLAKQKADRVVVSIFVNPTQFGENEDFDKYPNTLSNDKSLLIDNEVDVLFNPDADRVYPDGFATDIKLDSTEGILCGASRPGHFQGVAQVVKRLFDIVKPDVAIFGQKDYQQLLIIKQMVKNLSLDIDIKSGDIVRQKSGLAMSTRNQYLSTNEAITAANLYKILNELKQGYLNNQQLDLLINQAKKQLEHHFKLDYIEVLDANTLRQITDNTHEIAILSAVFLGPVRLIDNIIFRRKNV